MPDPAITVVVVDRFVHHSAIFDMNVESYRRKTCKAVAPTRSRPASVERTAIVRTLHCCIVADFNTSFGD